VSDARAGLGGAKGSGELESQDCGVDRASNICREKAQSVIFSVPRLLLLQHLAWHCDARARSHTDKSQLRTQT